MRAHNHLMLAAALLLSLSAFAQSPVAEAQKRLVKDQKLVFFGDGQADTSKYINLISQFYEDQFRHAQDPRAPYFMLMSREGNLAMGVGGQLELIGAYDFDGMIPSVNFIPYDIPMPMDPANRHALQTSVGQTQIFFSVFGNDSRFGKYQVYVSGKFGGSGNTFKLSKAYITVNDWTLGHATSTFVDPSSQPSTVETQGPNSETGGKRTLLRYMHGLDKHFKIAASLEIPSFQIPSGDYFESCANYLPDVAAFVQYGWGDDQHVRVSGVLTNMKYRDLKTNLNKKVEGWGVNLSTVFRPVAPLTVMAAANYGAGICSFVNDLAEGDLSLIPTKTEGELYAPRSFGYYGALQYNFSPSVFSTLIFSQERMLLDNKADYSGDAYKYGLYGTANVFWNITPRCQVAAEFNVGKRVNMDGAHRMAYRAGLLAAFSF